MKTSGLGVVINRPVQEVLKLMTMFVVLLIITSCATFSTRYYQDINGIAIDGYDPVAYFEEGAPKQGSPDYVHIWEGAAWRFESQENLDVFAADPASYSPEFGGYCAWAVSQNDLAEVDPQYWAIVEGKLYLNKDLEAHEKWRASQSESIALGNQYWPELSASLSTSSR